MQQSNAAGRGEKLFCPASVSAFQLKLRGGDGGDNFLAPKVCSDPRHRCAPYPAVPHSRARCPFAGGRTHVEFSSAHVEFSSLCWLLPRPGAAPGAQGCWECEGAARDTHDGLGVLLVFCPLADVRVVALHRFPVLVPASHQARDPGGQRAGTAPQALHTSVRQCQEGILNQGQHLCCARKGFWVAALGCGAMLSPVWVCFT